MAVFSTTDKGHFVFVVANNMDNAQTMVDADSLLRYVGSSDPQARDGVYALRRQWFQTKQAGQAEQEVTVVTTQDANELAQEVQGLLSLGWVIQGGMKVTPVNNSRETLFAQMLTRLSTDDSPA